MKFRERIHIALVSLLVVMLLVGCSVRRIPFDEAEMSYPNDVPAHDEYYWRTGSLPPDPFDNAWRMSQYYRYADEPYYRAYSSEFGYLPADRLSIDPNPNDSYIVDESPIRRSPSQHSIQPIESRQQRELRQSGTSSQRATNRSRHTYADRPLTTYMNSRNNAREQSKQLSNQSTTHNTVDEEREEQRRKARRRVQR